METIECVRTQGVGWLKLNRPEKLNALNETMLREMKSAIEQFEADDETNVIVLYGEGRAFSSGQDLTIASDADYGEYLQDVYHPLVRAIDACQKPIVAGIHGVVAGAGLSLALAADVRLVAASTKFSSAFIKIGLVADAGGPYRLRQLMRHDRALDWLWDGGTIDAMTASGFGLVTELVEDEAYEARLKTYAETLASKSPVAVRGMKALLRQTTLQNSLAEEVAWQRACGETAVHRHAMQAFLAK